MHLGFKVFFGHAKNIQSFFKEKGYEKPKYINPAIYYLNQIANINVDQLRLLFNEEYSETEVMS